jgi:hypothetical protein
MTIKIDIMIVGGTINQGRGPDQRSAGIVRRETIIILMQWDLPDHHLIHLIISQKNMKNNKQIF